MGVGRVGGSGREGKETLKQGAGKLENPDALRQLRKSGGRVR